MPNHVSTILTAPKEVLDSLKLSDAVEVDFNTVIPFPEKLSKVTAEVQTVRTQAEADKINAERNARDAALPEEMRKFMGYDGPRIHALTDEQALILIREYGALNWYEWDLGHWGTKWNAYDAERLSDTEVRFDTAWAHPEKVLIALSKKFPQATVTVKYADEDLGSNLGSYILQNGERVSEEMFSPDVWFAFAVRVKYQQSLEEFLRENGDDPEYLTYLKETYGINPPPKSIEA